MFAKGWACSPRKYKMSAKYDVRIPMRDGVTLSADIYYPDTEGAFPAILGYHCYNQHTQSAPITPKEYIASAFPKPGMEMGNGVLESGDPSFYVRRGYVHVVCNVRGTGKSEGLYPYLSDLEAEDGCDLIEWIASQPWCDGNVGMFACSYYGYTQYYVAAKKPPHLKCIFPSWAGTDQYNDLVYHGGILSYKFVNKWCETIHNLRYKSELLAEWGEERYLEKIEEVLADPEIKDVPEITESLKNPFLSSRNALACDMWLSMFDREFWERRRVKHDQIEIPTYIGCCWGMYGLHLPGAFRAFEKQGGPRKLFIGPPAYLDRPMYQLQYESLKWFDYWLKGIKNDIMEEAPIHLYMLPDGKWRESDEWPLPETKWTPFYLHENNRLWEREHFPFEGSTSFSDSPYGREFIDFTTSLFVEETEIIGPSVLELYAATTHNDILWFVSILAIDNNGKERLLVKGWLRGSHKDTLSEELSKPWLPWYTHDRRTELVPGEINKFVIPVLPTGYLFKMGTRLRLRIGCCDETPGNSMEGTTVGHLRRPFAARVTVFHNENYPSCLYVPVTGGNRIGTFIGGGQPYLNE